MQPTQTYAPLPAPLNTQVLDNICVYTVYVYVYVCAEMVHIAKYRPPAHANTLSLSFLQLGLPLPWLPHYTHKRRQTSN